MIPYVDEWMGTPYYGIINTVKNSVNGPY